MTSVSRDPIFNIISLPGNPPRIAFYSDKNISGTKYCSACSGDGGGEINRTFLMVSVLVEVGYCVTISCIQRSSTWYLFVI